MSSIVEGSQGDLATRRVMLFDRNHKDVRSKNAFLVQDWWRVDYGPVGGYEPRDAVNVEGLFNGAIEAKNPDKHPTELRLADDVTVESGGLVGGDVSFPRG